MNGYTIDQFLRFSTQLIVMEAFFAAPLPRRSRFPGRLAAALIVYYGLGMLLFETLQAVPYRYWFVEILYYAVLFGMTVALMGVVLKASWKELLFAAIGAYAAQHVMFCLEQIVRVLTGYVGEAIGVNTAMPWLLRELAVLLPFIAFGVLLNRWLVRPMVGRLQDADFRMGIVSAVILVVSVVLATLLRRTAAADDMVLNLICQLYEAISCSLGLAMQFSLAYRYRLAYDNGVLERLLHEEYRLHRMSKEAIDTINMKSHDLKYRIRTLRRNAADNDADLHRELGELDDSVTTYDSMVVTGNDAVDLIMSEKSLICQQRGISFTYVVDGGQLSFMSPPDVCSLIGNALDNAIEHVMQEPAEHRIISMNVSRTGGMVLFHVENDCSVPPTFRDGLPVTTKRDDRYHGFGTRSIRYVCERYGGEVSMRAEHGKFILDVLFTR